MRSFISFQPGETRGCVGCHETREAVGRADAAVPAGHGSRAVACPCRRPGATGRSASCATSSRSSTGTASSCHSGLKPAGRAGFLRRADGRATTAPTTRSCANRPRRPVATSARTRGSPCRWPSARTRASWSSVLRNGACSQAGDSSRDEDWLRLVTWIDANAPYHDGFINKRPATPPYDLPADRELAGDDRGDPRPALRRLPPAGRGLAARLDRPAPAGTKPVPDGAAGESRRRNGPLRESVYRDPATPTIRPCCSWSPQRCARPGTSPRRDLRALGLANP